MFKSVGNVPLVDFIYLVFTRMPGRICFRRLRYLLCFSDVFRALLNFLVCWFFPILNKQTNKQTKKKKERKKKKKRGRDRERKGAGGDKSLNTKG